MLTARKVQKLFENDKDVERFTSLMKINLIINTYTSDIYQVDLKDDGSTITFKDRSVIELFS